MDQKSPHSPETTVSKESPPSTESTLSKESTTIRYYDQIYSYCLRRLPDRESAEDTAQEVFCAFWEGPEFTDERVALGWLYRVAKSKLSDFYRDRGRRLANEAALSPEDLPDEAVPAVQDEAMKDPDAEDFGLDGVLGEVVRSLSGEERELFRDVWIEGISYAELSRKYGSSEGAVRTRVSRLKKKITGFLRSFLWPFGAAVLFRSIFHFFSGWM